MDFETLLSEREAAAFLRVAQKTLPVWRCRGRGPPFLKVGKTCLYRPADIKTWLDKQLIDPSRKTAGAAA